MDYIKEYRKFINGYYFNQGIRITIGITFPAVLLSYFGKLEIGLILSLGAMCVSTSDMPGPIHQRRNGMLVSAVLIFLVSLIIELINTHPVLLCVGLAVFTFLLSFIGVYGARVNAIGFAGMLIMVLSIDHRAAPIQVLIQSLFLLAGGIWYMLLSLALYGVRPYKVAQQALGDSIQSIADYFSVRAMFYNKDADLKTIYKKLMELQQQIQTEQNLLREILFKSRSIIKDTTVTGRALLVIFIESIDLFEKASATYYNYEAMHQRFDDSGILSDFQKMAEAIAEELRNIGLAVQAGHRSIASRKLNNELQLLRKKFEAFADKYRKPETFDALVNMRNLLNSLEEITLRIYTLHHYTRYDSKSLNAYELSGDYDYFVTKTNLGIEILKENLSLKSSGFRHSLRLTLAAVLGFLVAHLLQLHYSYWVLLTIIVILKPTYSVTRERNYQRLLGTIIGALGGLGLLLLIPSQNGQFAAMIVLMILTYTFVRTKYLASVIFMTGYIMIFFYLLHSHNFYIVFKHRMIDTLVGSTIALIAAYAFVPSWEKKLFNSYLSSALNSSKKYFETITAAFSNGSMDMLAYKLSRKAAFIDQANLSAAFTRMLNEPKSKRGDAKKANQLVVLIYTLNSHIVSLAEHARANHKVSLPENFTNIKEDIVAQLNDSLLLIEQKQVGEHQQQATHQLSVELEDLVKKRRQELQLGLRNTETRELLIAFKPVADQFLFISRIVGDIKDQVGKYKTANSSI